MSEAHETESPRGRKTREELNLTQRRRRRPESLNLMAGSNLGVPADCLDPEYRYYWANDKRGRLRNLTRNDDYDFVTADELGDDFDRDGMSAESDGRVSVVVEGSGEGALRAYLLKKPKAFHEADYEEMVARRQAMMEQRVYEGDLSAIGSEDETLDPEIAYVPKGNTLGDTAARRRGPIPNRLK